MDAQLHYRISLSSTKAVIQGQLLLAMENKSSLFQPVRDYILSHYK